ncbi:ACER3 (predicted) [Pycnogonum litorale]
MPALGIWGIPTSTLDWCERNYEVTPYMAEFWNTISNVFLMVPPFYGAVLAWRDNIEKKYILSYFSLFLVGVGSTLFHMTLKYEMQLCDELPMVYGSFVLVYCQAEIVCKGNPKFMKRLLIGLILYSIIFTVIYVGVKNPIFHQWVYGIIVSVILILNIYIARVISSAPTLFLWSAVFYILAFFCWNIDNIFCSKLTTMREAMPTAFGPVTQLHAIWHCLVGYAAYLAVIYCCHARLEQKKQDCKLEIGLFGIQVRNKRKHS